MLALKSLAWAAGLAVVGTALGFLYVYLFAGETCCGLEGLVPMVAGLVVGAVTGAVAPVAASLAATRQPNDEGATVARAVVGVPVTLVLAGLILHGIELGVDPLPVAIATGVGGGYATGIAWAWARRREIRVRPTGVATAFAVLLPVGWLVGKIAGFDPGDSFGTAIFLYLTTVVPLQAAATGYRVSGFTRALSE